MRAGTAATAILQIQLQLPSGRIKEGNETETDGDQERKSKGKEKRSLINLYLSDTGKVSVVEANDHMNAPRSDERTEDSGSESEQERFHDELPRQSAAGRAEGGT